MSVARSPRKIGVERRNKANKARRRSRITFEEATNFCVSSRKKTELKIEATKFCWNFKDIVNPENAAENLKKLAKKFDKN